MNSNLNKIRSKSPKINKDLQPTLDEEIKFDIFSEKFKDDESIKIIQSDHQRPSNKFDPIKKLRDEYFENSSKKSEKDASSKHHSSN